MTSLAESLGSIRRAESGATRDLREFRKALKGVQRVAVKAAQVEGRKVFKRNARRYARGQFADRQGRLRRIKDYSPAHGRRKRLLGLDRRRGVMRKGVLKTVQSPKAFQNRKDGFVIDYEAPNLTVTGRATVGKSNRAVAGKRIIGDLDGKRQVVGTGVKFGVTNRRSFRVNDYIGPFADDKAPGLGSITKGDERGIGTATNEAVAGHIRSVVKASGVLTSKDQARLNLDFTRVFG